MKYISCSPDQPIMKLWIQKFTFKPKYTRFYMFLKFMFSVKASKFGKIFTIDLTLRSKCQINSEDFFNFCGLLGKYELYLNLLVKNLKFSYF